MREPIRERKPVPADEVKGILAGYETHEEADERLRTELEAERDQLRKQVEKLLGAVEAMQTAPWGRREEREWGLYQAADQVRKELEGR